MYRLCDHVRALLLAEARCARVRAPCYVLGDVHGNYESMQTALTAIMPSTPAASPCTLLCLGDYVNRGSSSFEVGFVPVRIHLF
jgi:hypothetical protein